jgi:hypothetical protein
MGGGALQAAGDSAATEFNLDVPLAPLPKRERSSAPAVSMTTAMLLGVAGLVFFPYSKAMRIPL